MSDRTQLSMTNSGRLAVSKRASTGDGAVRLHRESEILRRAIHPGVVELLAGSSDGVEGAVVSTAFVGGGTLAEHMGTLDLQRGARIAAALAATLADLHERGIGHRRVTADHVLVTDGDQVRLCGFAEATLPDDAGPCHPDVAAVDVEAVASLVREIAERSAGDAAPLMAVADRVLNAGPLARPSMRTLAQALATLAGPDHDAAPPVGPAPRLLPARPSASGRHARLPRGPARVAVLGAIAASVVAVTAVIAAKATTSDTPSPPVAAPSLPPSVGVPATTTTVPLGSLPTSGHEGKGVRVWPPAPESGPEDVEVAGGVVSSAGHRWQVASADDLVAVGDWNCDGLATPAVVRSGTGRVWVYPHWADGTEAVPAYAPLVPGAVSAQAVAMDGCHHLEVVDTAGKVTRLDITS